MRLAVTGGAGFLGVHVCRTLAGKFEKVIALDIAPADPRDYPANVEYVRADVRDLAMLEKAFRSIDCVVHAAAALPLWKKKDIFDINVGGTRNVLEAAARNGIGRVIYISTTAVYGVPERHPVGEDHPLAGVGCYGRSKILAEEVCGEFRERGMCVPVVRPKTFIGEGRLGIFHLLYDWVHSGAKVPVIGSGKNRYQLLDVDDLVEAIYLLAVTPVARANATFNVGARVFGTVLEDVGGLCDYAGTGARVMPTPAWLVKPLIALLNGLGLAPVYRWVYETADRESYVSIDRISGLGWSPACSNLQALIRSYAWYVRHRDGLGAPGLTHRTAWDQGILRVFKRLL